MISIENPWNQSEYETILVTSGYGDKADCMTKFCPLSDGPQNWQRRYFSTFWDLPFSIVFIILTHCGSKLSYWLFKLTMRDLIQQTGKVHHNQSRRHRRQDQPSANKTAFPLYITIIFKKDCNSLPKNKGRGGHAKMDTTCVKNYLNINFY